MNPDVRAEEFDHQIEKLFSGRTVESGSDCPSLLSLASDLRLLPDPDFKRRLMADLVEEAAPTETPSASLGEDHQANVAILSSILPTLTRKRFRVFPADHRSFLVSFASHAALVLLIASGICVGHHPITKTTDLLTSKLTYLGSGGGGGGDRSPIQATRGTPPKFSDQQLAPPVIVVRHPNVVLPVDPTVLGAEVKLPQSNQIGDLMSSNVIIPSNGAGSRAGAGSGSHGGLGDGPGAGVGPGSDAGVGGGPFHPGVGVTAPRAIYDPEPEYSEEARKVHFQGAVVLSIVVDQAGHARDIRVSRSAGLGLDEKAIEAVKKWQFEPGKRDGHPVAVAVNVEVNFRLY